METPAKANNKYRGTLRSTYIDGVDSALNVSAIPANLPTIVTVGWNTDYETHFRVEGTSGTNSSNYALTGIEKLSGYSGNLPENLAINCLNHEEFFNQWADQIAAAQEAAEQAQEAVEGVVLTEDRFAPQGFLINGKIVTSISSNNLVVAIKTLAGEDPSADDPVYVRIGNTVRTITAALSLTTNAGANTYNAGSSELATKEIDYFVYLLWSTSGTPAVVLGISRKAGGRIADTSAYFAATATNPRFLNTNAAYNTTDEMECIGRFNATLSAGAGYTWTIPATSIIINRPINHSRWLEWVPTYSGSGSMVVATPVNTRLKYKVVDDDIEYDVAFGITTGGTSANKIAFTLPFERDNTVNELMIGTGYIGDGSQHLGMVHFNGTNQNTAVLSKYNEAVFAIIAVTVFGIRGGHKI